MVFTELMRSSTLNKDPSCTTALVIVLTCTHPPAGKIVWWQLLNVLPSHLERRDLSDVFNGKLHCERWKFWLIGFPDCDEFEYVTHVGHAFLGLGSMFCCHQTTFPVGASLGTRLSIIQVVALGLTPNVTVFVHCTCLSKIESCSSDVWVAITSNKFIVL